ncbi:MAG: hypothetical protein GEU86_05125 [Actinophytocola sp.]|nr:hypothetical protein [Actinophytocola sp.]
MEVMQYHADVTREGRFWHIHVREIDRVTQARRYSEVEEMARDLIEVMTNEPNPSVSIAVELPARVRAKLEHAEQLSVESERAKSEAAKERRLAVRALVDEGVSQREAAVLLGMSYQRVSQLVNS